MPVCPLDTKHDLQEMSGKHVHCVLQLSNIVHDAMTKIHTTISPGENLPHLGSKRKQMNVRCQNVGSTVECTYRHAKELHYFHDTLLYRLIQVPHWPWRGEIYQRSLWSVRTVNGYSVRKLAENACHEFMSVLVSEEGPSPTNEMHFSLPIRTECPFYGPHRPWTAFTSRIRLCRLQKPLQDAQILYCYYPKLWYMSDD